MDAERQRSRLAADLKHLKELTALRAFQKEFIESVRDEIRTLDTPKMLPVALSHGTWDEETAVLLLGDVHLGQVTNARVNGGWAQTPEVTKAQFKMLAKALYRIWEIQNASTPWRHLVILGLGDMCEGAHMRTSQAKRSTPVTHQALEFGKQLAEFITFCLTFFEKVTYESVPGNHGRVSQRAGEGGLDELDPAESFDWLGGQIASLILKPSIDAKRVSVYNHQTISAETEIMGHRIFFEHGSSLRGGGGWGGIPFYGHTRMGSSYRDLEGDFSLIATAHFHRSFDLPTGYKARIIGTGSFPPTTPFIYGSKHQATRPSQVLLSFHKTKGITQVRTIYLDTPRSGVRGADACEEAS